jgi:small-conductance mechanosensitive channel
LIGGSLQEVLSSIIFLFVKHPFDVGDRVNIDSVQYTVKEIRLLSTVFLDTSGLLVQAPNLILNQKVCGFTISKELILTAGVVDTERPTKS